MSPIPPHLAVHPWYADHLPRLRDLDPLDDTRPPDGSRVVDTLALRAVYMEVCCG